MKDNGTYVGKHVSLESTYTGNVVTGLCTREYIINGDYHYNKMVDVLLNDDRWYVISRGGYIAHKITVIE